MMDEEALARDIGKRLKVLRLQRRKSLQAIASRLGISYQQMRKYETGQNRISASTLYRAAGVLGVDIALFFDQSSRSLEPSGKCGALAEDGLTAALDRIHDPEVRQRLYDLILVLERQG